MVELVQYGAQQIGASISSTTRPALTFFAIQLFAFFSVQFGADINDTLGLSILAEQMDPSFAWLVNPVTLMLAFILSIGEMLAQHDEDVSALMNDFNVHQYINAFGAFSTALLISTLDASTFQGLESSSSYMGPGGGNELAQTAKLIVETSPPAATWGERAEQLAVIVGAVGGNQILSYYRGQLHEWLDDLSLLKVWQRIETGGTVVALFILLIAPILCMILLLFTVAAGFVMGFIVKRVMRVLDQRARVACPHCETMIRGEAIACFSCGGDVTPQVLLTEKSKTLGLWEALKLGRSAPEETVAVT